MASSRQQPGDMTFQVRAIPKSLTENLQEWGPNRQLAAMVDAIGMQDHIADLKERVHNLSMTAVHQRDLHQATTAAILAGVLPVLVLALLATGAGATWRFCGPLIANKAQAWAKARRDRQQPYSLYIKRRRWNNPPPTPELPEDQEGSVSIDIPPPSPLLGATRADTEGDSSFTATSAPPTPPPPPPPAEQPSATALPSHPTIRMTKEEMQVHRDAIRQQQMLGRRLLAELRDNHRSKHHT